jgi:hypothetical protein
MGLPQLSEALDAALEEMLKQFEEYCYPEEVLGMISERAKLMGETIRQRDHFCREVESVFEGDGAFCLTIL